MPPRTLVTGPSGSGKSRWAETLACRSEAKVVYIATGPGHLDDDQWQERLLRHRQRRPVEWHTWEVEGELSPAIARLQSQQLGLVDSLGTWVAAHLECESLRWDGVQEALLAAVRQCPAELMLVCEEVSWGVVPATELGCRFRDRLSDINRHLAELASAHWLVVQGRALDLCTLGTPVPALD